MLTIVLTWVGAVLGLTLLVAMAAGTFVVDVDEALRERRRRSPEPVPDQAHPAG
ncbi:hypothetical protein GCM10022222_19920 [Amycolatopsis ultiminotia]|uniref:Uncharacterized protein n=1 Tax=Amycolatopsis ultiminotia TaxID=543629 RepID=A0ABP6VJU1_9PSEU